MHTGNETAAIEILYETDPVVMKHILVYLEETKTGIRYLANSWREVYVRGSTKIQISYQ